MKDWLKSARGQADILNLLVYLVVFVIVVLILMKVLDRV